MLGKLEQITNTLVGNEREYSLEERVFNSVALLNGITNILGLVAILNLHMAHYLFFTQLIAGILFLLCYYFSRFSKMTDHLRWPFIFITCVFVFLSAIYKGGLMGGSHYYIFPAIIISIIFSKTLQDYVFSFCFFAAMEMGLVYISAYFPNWITPYENAHEQMVDLSLIHI